MLVICATGIMEYCNIQKMYDALKTMAYLVTYAARGVVKRSMIEVGFKVEKLAGPRKENVSARKIVVNL
jgi:tRNA U34 5-methylaminomethyl-2-thiouridine-forming methyltransferase MnmC